MKTTPPTVTFFPKIVASLGGAEHVTVSKRFAKVKLPGRDDLVRIPLSKLPPQSSWTAFSLADAAATWQLRS